MSPAAARLFRLLGLHSGPDIAAPAAAALAGLPVREARGLLVELTRANLLTERFPGRYTLYDLLRVYAAERVQAEETLPERERSLGRLHAWYLHTAAAAYTHITPQRRRPHLEPAPDLCRPLQFTTHDQALDWCETERANLVAAVHQAAGSGRPSIAWQLPAVLWGFFYLRSHTHDWVDTARAGLAAARAHEDRRGEAQALADLAAALRASGRFDEAADHLRRAMVAYRDLGDADGRRSAVSNLGTCTSSPASSARRSSTSAADWPSDTSSATPGRRGSASATWATPTSASTGSTRRSSAWSSRWTSCARTATAGSRASPSTSSVRPIAASIATTTPSAITTRPSRRTGTSATGGERATRWATWATPNWPPTNRRPLATAGGRHWRSSWSSTTGTRRRSVNAFAGWVTTTARPRPRGSGDTAGPHPYDGWEVTGVQLPGQLASW